MRTLRGQVSGRGAFGGGLRGALQVAGAFDLLLLQPVLDVLSRNGSFFVVHGLGPVQLAAGVLLAALVLPLALWFAAALPLAMLGRSDRTVPWLLAAIVGLGAMAILERAAGVPSVGSVPIAVALGALAAWCYETRPAARSLATYLSVSIPAAPLAFLLVSPAQALVFGVAPFEPGAGAASDAPVFVIVFDELPTVALLDRELEIDAHHFPHFARLARDAHWFRNASTVSHGTEAAVPALLTGRFPEAEQLPILRDHPSNLLTLMSPSHRVLAFQTVTDLCPREVCPSAERDRIAWDVFVSDLGIVAGHVLLPGVAHSLLPPLAGRWAGFRDAAGETSEPIPAAEEQRWRRKKKRIRHGAARREIFRDFVASIEPGRGVLRFVHVLLPHVPYQFLADGRVYAYDSHLPAWVRSKEMWLDDEVLVAQGYQRLLLQTAYMDAMLGSFLARLDALGLYDEALIVVTADHGVNFISGESRRKVSERTLPTILAVPLLVKEPGQTRGLRHDDNVETIDVLPTIADLVGLELPELPGRSALSSDWQPRPIKRVRYGGVQVYPADLLPRMREAVRDKYALFGAPDGVLDLFGLGPLSERIGDSTASLVRGAAGEKLSVTLHEPERFEDVSPDGDFVPALVRGTLLGDAEGARWIAVALNGRLAGTGRSYVADGANRFSVLVRPDLLRRGANSVEPFLLERAAGRWALRPLPLGGPGSDDA